MTYDEAINWLTTQVVWKGAYYGGDGKGNYTIGRQGTTVRYITMHHIVGTMESCASAWATPGRNGSSHFAVGERGAWQFVDTDNTAWCNGNWNSNLESISIEHEGDWRFGYTNRGCIEKSAELIAYLRVIHPTIVGFQRHRDVSLTGTVCPGDLPCEEIWNRSNEILNAWSAPAPTPEPAPVPLAVTDIPNKTMVCVRDANLWDLSFTTWAEAKAVKVLPKGTPIEVSATVAHKLGGVYYLTEYSFRQGIMNGVNAADLAEVATPEPTPEPTPVPSPEPTPEPAPEPLPTPDTQLDRIEKNTNAIIKLIMSLKGLMLNFFKKLK